MYISANIAKRIKEFAKIKGIKINDMLTACELSKNTLSSMISGGSTPKSENLARIADYLDCSVDYLLGRTDDPELHTLKTNNKMEIRKETISYKLAAYGGKNEVVEDDDESKTT